MKKYTAIIVDDEQLAIDVIKNYIDRHPQIELLQSFKNPVEAFSYLNTQHVDLAFVDIEMPHLLGTELISSLNTHTQFVMVTSYSNYAIESFDLEVLDYLLKPVPFNRFSKTIDRFTKRMQSNEEENQYTVPPSFFIKEGDEYIKVEVPDIDYVEGMKDYAKIQCGNNFYLALKTLKALEEILAPYNFIRIHKSYIVSIDRITQYNGRAVIIDNHAIPVGSSYRKTLKTILENRQL
ncbi:LytTR family DNA-binding domain-containing protein [Halosquirtibacter xylanolyticus]|uniref:LytR/AlgR family response regulator transcription factor n=1 Tax=Halosquirtibacter xylanolyticus TaxID=3374599 RepID=UPI0037486B2D|nr:LytTR family DNA-binding domain-containing protein [Prolixibacteraceae bacterium]